MTRNNITNENWMDELDKVFKEANLKWGQEALISPTIHEIISQEKKALLDKIEDEIQELSQRHIQISNDTIWIDDVRIVLNKLKENICPENS